MNSRLQKKRGVRARGATVVGLMGLVTACGSQGAAEKPEPPTGEVAAPIVECDAFVASIDRCIKNAGAEAARGGDRALTALRDSLRPPRDEAGRAALRARCIASSASLGGVCR